MESCLPWEWIQELLGLKGLLCEKWAGAECIKRILAHMMLTFTTANVKDGP